MTTSGTVREWHDDDGWGVIDSADTSGGCWAHFSVVETAGYRRLLVGQKVTLEFEAADQDGYAYRAISVASGAEPQPGSRYDSKAYSSTLTISSDSTNNTADIE